MKPLPPLNAFDRKAGKPAHDKAKAGYSLHALERLLLDCDEQPRWREHSDLCCAYYDGHQFSPKQVQYYRQNKLDPRSINLIGRVINGVLGQEAKSRRDPRLEPDDDEGADVADVHRSEMWWDWRAKDRLLTDAKWLVRRQWKDLDEVAALMPEHAETLKNAANGWQTWLTDDATDEHLSGINPFYEADRAWTRVNRSEWIDGARERIRMYEVWYRVPAQTVVMRVGQKWITVDERNPAHVEAISRGLVKLEKRITSQVRKAIFAGPYRLTDEATNRTTFPYIPFWCFREDGDRSPYGLITGMLPAQDEYNERRMRIQWMLKAQQLIVESDALDPAYNTIEDLAGSMMRPDMVAVLNANRKNMGGKGIEFRNDFQLQREQFEQMQDAKQLIQDIPGIYSSMLGNAPAGVTANSAMQTLVEQGMVAMGEVNDNYSLARRAVYDQLVDLIAEDHASENLTVRIGVGSTRREVVLNTIDQQTGMPVNQVDAARFNTGLNEVPASPAYMMQMSQILGDMIRAMAGTPQAMMLIPHWVESTTMLGGTRHQLADDMRRASGLPVTGDRATAQEWQQQQQQAQQQKQQMEAAAAQIQMKQAEAKAKLDDSRANLARAQSLAALMTADATTADEPDEQAAIAEALAEAMGRKPMQQAQPQPAEAMQPA